eukprot:1749899-Rhodomonas_salina.3
MKFLNAKRAKAGRIKELRVEDALCDRGNKFFDAERANAQHIKELQDASALIKTRLGLPRCA